MEMVKRVTRDSTILINEPSITSHVVFSKDYIDKYNIKILLIMFAVCLTYLALNLDSVVAKRLVSIYIYYPICYIHLIYIV